MAAALKNGTKRARGGKRKGSGRKPNLAKAALKRVQADRVADAEFCLDYMVRVVRGKVPKVSVSEKIHAAIYVCDRVWGKAPQAVTLPDGPLMRIILPPPATRPPAGVGPKA